jgi:hypothetical protein
MSGNPREIRRRVREQTRCRVADVRRRTERVACQRFRIFATLGIMRRRRVTSQ